MAIWQYLWSEIITMQMHQKSVFYQSKILFKKMHWPSSEFPPVLCKGTLIKPFFLYFLCFNKTCSYVLLWVFYNDNNAKKEKKNPKIKAWLKEKMEHEKHSFFEQ